MVFNMPLTINNSFGFQWIELSEEGLWLVIILDCTTQSLGEFIISHYWEASS